MMITGMMIRPRGRPPPGPGRSNVTQNMRQPECMAGEDSETRRDSGSDLPVNHECPLAGPTRSQQNVLQRLLAGFQVGGCNLKLSKIEGLAYGWFASDSDASIAQDLEAIPGKRKPQCSTPR